MVASRRIADLFLGLEELGCVTMVKSLCFYSSMISTAIANDLERWLVMHYKGVVFQVEVYYHLDLFASFFPFFALLPF